MRKGKHYKKGYRHSYTKEDICVFVSVVLGAIVGTALGIIYFVRFPQDIPSNHRVLGKIMGYYTGLGIGGGYCASILFEKLVRKFRARK